MPDYRAASSANPCPACARTGHPGRRYSDYPAAAESIPGQERDFERYSCRAYKDSNDGPPIGVASGVALLHASVWVGGRRAAPPLGRTGGARSRGALGASAVAP